ncbi:MAG TPA: ATP-binding protein, partial [Firmicutes bacterium]|nr:ATP-binding protein [Candidatus Fermentithermobacillaceae bacterium]
HTLVEDLKRAYADNRLDRRMRVYIAPKVLIIDEVGYRPFDSDFATNHIGKCPWFSRKDREVRLNYSARKDVVQVLRRILGKEHTQ